MGLFDSVAVSELDDESLRLIRDRRGRFALSRPSMRQKFHLQSYGTPNSTPTLANGKPASIVVANSAKVLSPRRSPSLCKPPISEDSIPLVPPEWTAVEDLCLLDLHRKGKSWDYIEGKLDDKGKSVSELKVLLDELMKQDQGTSEQEQENAGQAKEEERAKSPSKKEKKKMERDRSNSRKGDRRSREWSNESTSVGQNATEEAKNDANDQGSPKEGDEKAAPAVSKKGYIGKMDRGEVRYVNGLPVLYKHSGTDAEQLDAETVATMYKEAAKHDRSKWLTVVSRLFDQTGIRMDPEVARVALGDT